MNRAALKSKSKTGHRFLGISAAIASSIPASIKVLITLAVPVGLA